MKIRVFKRNNLSFGIQEVEKPLVFCVYPEIPPKKYLPCGCMQVEDRTCDMHRTHGPVFTVPKRNCK